MAQPQLLETLSELNIRIENLLEVQNELKKRIEQLEKRNSVLEEQHLNDVKLLEKTNKDIEFLTLSHRLAGSPDTIISARRKIGRLIGTIDNCIRMINEE